MAPVVSSEPEPELVLTHVSCVNDPQVPEKTWTTGSVGLIPSTVIVAVTWDELVVNVYQTSSSGLPGVPAVHVGALAQVTVELAK
jgi:hypothetical protein